MSLRVPHNHGVIAGLNADDGVRPCWEEIIGELLERVEVVRMVEAAVFIV